LKGCYILSMPDAYLILCHDRAAQINFLTHYLGDLGHDCYIHLDAQSSIASQIRQDEHSFLIEPRVAVQWADWSMIEASLQAMRAITSSGKRYRYIHLISGHCLPAMPHGKMEKELDESYLEGKLWVECSRLSHTSCYDGRLRRVSIWYPRALVSRQGAWHHRYYSPYIKFWEKLGLVRPFYEHYAPFYGGSQWWSLRQDVIEKILDYHDNHPGLARYYKHVFCSDELYIQHLLVNCGFEAQIQNDNRRYIDWSGANSQSPRNLQREDWAKVRQSGAFFARKFQLSEEECAEYLCQLNSQSSPTNGTAAF